MLNIRIEYCVMWNYEPQAFRLKEEISKEFMNAYVNIKPGSKGAFEVFKNDMLVFSKLELDRFPNDGEILQLIKENKWVRLKTTAVI